MERKILIIVLIVISYSESIYSQNRKLDIPIIYTEEDTIHSNLEKSISLQMSIHNKISSHMDKEITRKELDEKAMPQKKNSIVYVQL